MPHCSLLSTPDSKDVSAVAYMHANVSIKSIGSRVALTQGEGENEAARVLGEGDI